MTPTRTQNTSQSTSQNATRVPAEAPTPATRVRVAITWDITARTHSAITGSTAASNIGTPPGDAAPARIRLTLDTQTRRAVVTLEPAPPINARANARAENQPTRELLGTESDQISIIRSDHALHLCVPDLLSITALLDEDGYNPLYVRTPILQTLGLAPGSYDRPRVTIGVDPAPND